MSPIYWFTLEISFRSYGRPCHFESVTVSFMPWMSTILGRRHKSPHMLQNLAVCLNYHVTIHTCIDRLWYIFKTIYIIYIFLRNRGCRDVYEPETHVIATWPSRDKACWAHMILNVKKCVKNRNLKHFCKVTLQGLSWLQNYRDMRNDHL